MVRIFLALVYPVLLALGAGKNSDTPCNAVTMAYGPVCVCNASYCDTVTRPSTLKKARYYHYLTSQDSPGFTHSTGTFDKKKTHLSNITAVFTIDSSKRYQEILGIGGSFTDAVGIAFNTLPAQAQDHFIESYFGSSGLEYSAARVPIGASDMSTALYTYDDLDSPDDADLTHFNLTQEDYLYKIPLIQRAIAASPHDIRLVGCAFVAPAWMKTNADLHTGYIKKQFSDAWAKYHIKFLDSYADNNIKFWMVTGGNEVAFAYFLGSADLIGMSAMPDNHRQWAAENLGPQIAASQHSDVKLLILDDMRNFAVFWMNRFFLDKAAWNVTAGVALHWYYDWLTPDDIPEIIHQQFPDKLIAYTETGINVLLFGGSFLEPGSWYRGALYAYNLIDNLNHWTSLYLDWNLALNTEGGPYLQLPLDAPVIINTSAGEFYKNPMFYVMGHFSKFMGQGTFRVSVDARYADPASTAAIDADLDKFTMPTFPPFGFITLPQNVTCTASVNPTDHSVSVIVLNTNDYAVNVTIADVAAGNISTTVQPQSLNTFLYWPTSSVSEEI